MKKQEMKNGEVKRRLKKILRACSKLHDESGPIIRACQQDEELNSAIGMEITSLHMTLSKAVEKAASLIEVL